MTDRVGQKVGSIRSINNIPPKGMGCSPQLDLLSQLLFTKSLKFCNCSALSLCSQIRSWVKNHESAREHPHHPRTMSPDRPTSEPNRELQQPPHQR